MVFAVGEVESRSLNRYHMTIVEYNHDEGLSPSFSRNRTSTSSTKSSRKKSERLIANAQINTSELDSFIISPRIMNVLRRIPEADQDSNTFNREETPMKNLNEIFQGGGEESSDIQ